MRTKPKKRRPASASKSVSRTAGAKPSAQKARAKVFWTGRSQAVRLPKEFRFQTDSVLIKRDGNKVILEPDGGWPEGYVEWLMTGPPIILDIPPDPLPRSIDHLFADALPHRHRRR